MFVPLHNREYKVGDTGLVLVYGDPNAGATVMSSIGAMNRDQSTRRKLAGERLFLAETQITGAMRKMNAEGDEDGNMDDYISFYYPRFPGEMAYPSHATQYLSGVPHIRYAFSSIRACGAYIEDNRELLGFLVNFLYPVITTGSGYRNMLRDIAVTCGRDPANITLPADSAPLMQRIAELGIPVRTLNMHRTSSVSFPDQIKDDVEASVIGSIEEMLQRYAVMDAVANPPPIRAGRGGVAASAAAWQYPPGAVRAQVQEAAVLRRWDELAPQWVQQNADPQQQGGNR